MIAAADTPLIVDAHNDLLLELEQRRFEEAPFERHWLRNLERGGVGLQVCPVFGSELEALPELILRRNLLQVAAFQRAVRENAAHVVAVGSKADLDPVERRERIGLMLSMEGAEALGYETTLIDVFYELGLRMVSLTWNRRNPFADGAAEPDGGGPLSNLGRELVDRIAELGIVLDLVHVERTHILGRDRANDRPRLREPCGLPDARTDAAQPLGRPVAGTRGARRGTRLDAASDRSRP